MTLLALGHHPDPDPSTLLCLACGRPCIPYQQAWKHAKPVCGAPMRYGETCARSAGHSRPARGSGHRTRYAMDCQAQSRRAA